MLIEKIVSGGQTGVDRAALDVALELGIPCGGWCPRGRLAEDGRIPDRYPLAEMPTASYPARTRRNVLESDATLLLTVGALEGGTQLTATFAWGLNRPTVVVDLLEACPRDRDAVRAMVHLCRVRALNVAGPRASKQPTVYDLAVAFLKEVLVDA